MDKVAFLVDFPSYLRTLAFHELKDTFKDKVMDKSTREVEDKTSG